MSNSYSTSREANTTRLSSSIALDVTLCGGLGATCMMLMLGWHGFALPHHRLTCEEQHESSKRKRLEDLRDIKVAIFETNSIDAPTIMPPSSWSACNRGRLAGLGFLNRRCENYWKTSGAISFSSPFFIRTNIFSLASRRIVRNS